MCEKPKGKKNERARKMKAHKPRAKLGVGVHSPSTAAVAAVRVLMINGKSLHRTGIVLTITGKGSSVSRSGSFLLLEAERRNSFCDARHSSCRRRRRRHPHPQRSSWKEHGETRFLTGISANFFTNNLKNCVSWDIVFFSRPRPSS